MTQRVCILVLAGLLHGCAANQIATDGFRGFPAGARVAVIRPNLKFYRVTAGGVTEPAPDWTQTARRHFDAALAAYVARAEIQISAPDKDSISDGLFDFARLHAAVGGTIVRHHFRQPKLPSKYQSHTRQHRFDWSLGPGVADLGLRADYALFIYYRDYQATTGRVGVSILALALGMPVFLGHQGGFASLVDLRSGDVVWFNHVSASIGDLRDPQGATLFVERLLQGLSGVES